MACPFHQCPSQVVYPDPIGEGVGGASSTGVAEVRRGSPSLSVSIPQFDSLTGKNPNPSGCGSMSINAMVFAIHDCSFVARSAQEAKDGSQVRIDKIYKIIAECRYGIHAFSPGFESRLSRFIGDLSGRGDMFIAPQ